MKRGGHMPKPLYNHNKMKSGFQADRMTGSSKIRTRAKKLRQKRSTGYMEAVKQLDVNGCKMTTDQYEQLIQVMDEEFADIPNGERLEGIVAKCYLGDEFEVHALDLIGNIIHHYKKGEAMPKNLERARRIAQHGSYAYIEVYQSMLIAIRADGSGSVIN